MVRRRPAAPEEEGGDNERMVVRKVLTARGTGD